MPNIVKGSDMGGLLRYLAGPGRANEHSNQRVLAGDLVTVAVYAGRIDVARANELAKLLDSPRQTVLRGEPVFVTNYRKAHALIAEGVERRAAFDQATRDQNVWHCSLSLDPKEGKLDDETWSRIARRFMAEMGFTDSADGSPDVRWTAIHHGLTKAGGDHIHVAMSVVRPDGSLADVRRDWPRSQDAARVIEREFGLRVLASREERTTEQATRPDERGRAARVGAAETDREALRRRVRAAALASENEAEFVAELRSEGMVLRPRYAKGSTEEVVGYAIRMPAQRNVKTGVWEKAIWYGGGQLSKDLTLSALRSWAGWDTSPESHEAAVAEWGRALRTRSGRAIRPNRMTEHEAIGQLSRWSQYMRTIPLEDRDGWAKAASQTAGLFAAASVRTETTPGPLDQLSRQLARAGQLPAHRRRPHSAQPESGVRAVARMLWSTHSAETSKLALVIALTECLLEIHDMLAATERAAAAAAMASKARQALTEIHMRAAGIDPARPHVREQGSPAWAAAYRAGAIVARVERSEVEAEIKGAHDRWRMHRAAWAGDIRVPTIDEFGHMLRTTDEHKQEWQKALDRAAGPLTPPDNADRTTKKSIEQAEQAAAKAAARSRRGVDPTRFGRLRRVGPPDSRMPDPYGYDQTEDPAPSPKKSSTPEWERYTPPPGHNYGQQHRRDHGFER
ncbi:relaxase/mobilization nuclease domain-containing protein [Nocardia gipuzkoensis]|uniref:relaxase/mobilization nuclease domain-containing protein n=1 Tax=Nocardia gipuzkoensis TaxID=2749991 RepID=UPI00237DE46F|nr:hypothetical protein [Nocardia gipuzkoensis]MDE1674693.1 hypothetical protein [Nocardia gipuzkoensis]